MKKLLLLFFPILLFACSSDNDEPNEINQDPIIGTWKLIKMTEYPSNANPVVTTYDECFMRSRVTFLSNGNVEDTFYSLNSDGTCTLQQFEYQTTLSYTWENIAANKYRFTSEIISHGNRSVQSKTPESIIFPNTSTMEIMHMGTNRPSNDPINVEYYINSYQRVN